MLGFNHLPTINNITALQTHLICTMQQLFTIYSKAAYCIAGDTNSLPITQIVAALPHCHQAVTLNTYKDKILDCGIWLNTTACNPANSATHVPIDHNNAVAVPLAGAGTEAKTRQYTVRTSHPPPDSGLRQMGVWISSGKLC